MKPLLAASLPPLLCVFFLFSGVFGSEKFATTLSEPGTCQDVVNMDTSTAAEVLRKTRNLVASQFFAIFHVSVDTPCPFWNDDAGKCAIRECSVCDCPADEVPVLWRNADAAASTETAQSYQNSMSAAGANEVSAPVVNSAIPLSCEKTHGDSDTLNDIDRSHSGAMRTDSSMRNWAVPPAIDDWTVQGPTNGVEMLYVDLRKNPERYTGFSGRETHRIWSAIYDENCIVLAEKCKNGVCDPDTCKEERVFHKLISGIHTSITMHIAAGYLLGTKWGTNINVFETRVHRFPERLENLKLTLGLVLRAVAKVAPSLDPAVFPYSTGNTKQDEETASRVRSLLAHPMLARGCEELLFDESDMFVSQSRDRLPEFRGAFRNISMIMDCVGCEKCRLWGKLQFLGLGTALRILFTENDQHRLKRNEIIALINLLHKLLSSFVWAAEFEAQLETRARQYTLLGRFAGIFAVFLFSVLVFKNRHQRKQKPKPSKVDYLQDMERKREAGAKPGQPSPQQLRRRRLANAD